ncbi:DUF3800 domain-containing protein [Myceligenerans cantabricum]
MLIAHVDESYEGDLYCIGAAVAEQRVWETVEDGFEKLRQLNNDLHGTPLDAEFHAHCIMNGRADWKPLRGRHREATQLYKSALEVARDANVTYILRGMNVARQKARYRYPNPPHSVVLGHLLERINDYAKATTPGEQCIVVADDIASKQAHLREFEEYQRIGTGGYRTSRLEQISAPFTFSDSRRVDGIQVADLGAYIFRRHSDPTPVHPKAKKAQRMLWTVIAETCTHSNIWLP